MSQCVKGYKWRSPRPLSWASVIGSFSFSPCSCRRAQPRPRHLGTATILAKMGLLFLVLLLSLSCVLGLPFYNGFFYSHGPHGRTLSGGYGEGRWLLGLSPGSFCDIQVSGWDTDRRIFLIWASKWWIGLASKMREHGLNTLSLLIP